MNQTGQISYTGGCTRQVFFCFSLVQFSLKHPPTSHSCLFSSLSARGASTGKVPGPSWLKLGRERGTPPSPFETSFVWAWPNPRSRKQSLVNHPATVYLMCKKKIHETKVVEYPLFWGTGQLRLGPRPYSGVWPQVQVLGFFYRHGSDFTAGLDIYEGFDVAAGLFVAADFDIWICVWFGHSSAAEIFSTNRFEFLKILVRTKSRSSGFGFCLKNILEKALNPYNVCSYCTYENSFL